jgi:uncharacterized integral membrane protein
MTSEPPGTSDQRGPPLGAAEPSNAGWGGVAPEPVPPASEPVPVDRAEPAGGRVGTLPQHQIRRTRTGGLWVAVTGAAIVLLLLLIFILQNGRQVQVSFFGLDGRLPLGVAMLLSAVAGALLVALLGSARIVQLRLVARRHRTVEATAGRWSRRRQSTRDPGDTATVQRRP